MNKIVSIQQVKKSCDSFDEQDQIDEYTDEDLSDINNTSNNIINDILFSHVDSLNSSDNINNKLNKSTHLCKSNNKSQAISEHLCQNEKCKEVVSEIEKYTEECEFLEKKITLIDKAKTEEFFEISSQLSKICKQIDEIQPIIDACQGINLQNFSYEQLTKIEINMLKLLIKIRSKISKIESDIMKGNINKPEDNSTICKICKSNEINCLMHPCSHVAICTDCAEKSIKCPICFKFIEYFDKIYLPST